MKLNSYIFSWIFRMFSVFFSQGLGMCWWKNENVWFSIQTLNASNLFVQFILHLKLFGIFVIFSQQKLQKPFVPRATFNSISNLHRKAEIDKSSKVVLTQYIFKASNSPNMYLLKSQRKSLKTSYIARAWSFKTP